MTARYDSQDFKLVPVGPLRAFLSICASFRTTSPLGWSAMGVPILYTNDQSGSETRTRTVVEKLMRLTKKPSFPPA